MLSPADQISRIEARKRKLAEEMDRLDQEMEKLNTAVEVILSLEREDRDGGADAPEAKEPQTAADEAVTKLGPPRPNGCPTNFEMVDAILASAEKEGKDGLRVPDVIEEMRRRYWPGLQDVQVSAPIYAFVRKGRFRKTASGKLKRIKKNKEGQELIEPNSGEPPSNDGNGHLPMNG